MKKLLVCLSLIFVFTAIGGHAQTRKSVSAAEVNGTFRDYFEGKFKGSFNEIKILALGKGKVRVAFSLVYPYFIGNTNEMSANVGEADGTAMIEGDTATFSPEENSQCVISIKFVKRGTIEVSQQGASECGFGFNVNSQGTYKKTSNAKPSF